LSGLAVALVLGAAALHAWWNTLIAGARDTHAATAVAMAASVLAVAPVAALTWELDAGALPYVAASALLEIAYFALLASAYAGASLTTVYPIARGAAPVLALAASVAVLSAPVSAVQAAGVLVVAGGVVLVRGLGRPPGRGVLLALGVAACVAGYTLVDDRGVEHASPAAYYVVVVGLAAAPYAAALAAARGGADRLRAAVTRRALLAGAGMGATYLLVLLALQRAEAAPVAALRETGVVIAMAAAVLIGREHVPPARLAGAAAVVAGAVAIALG
jgi:drug/metabolite transporter (DMT)-like permease